MKLDGANYLLVELRHFFKENNCMPLINHHNSDRFIGL